MVGIRTS